jgi:hypothetical protein
MCLLCIIYFYRNNLNYVAEIRRCPYIGACQISLWIDHLNHTIEFFPNMTTTYDGYSYTVNQVKSNFICG